MALFKFTKAIIEDKEIEVFNYGDMERDFTYVEDLTEAVFQLIEKFLEQAFLSVKWTLCPMWHLTG